MAAAGAASAATVVLGRGRAWAADSLVGVTWGGAQVEATPGETVFETDAVRMWHDGDGVGVVGFKTKMNTVSDGVLDGLHVEGVRLARRVRIAGRSGGSRVQLGRGHGFEVTHCQGTSYSYRIRGSSTA